MSSLHLFAQKKWFRRLWLIALGLLLGYAYVFNYTDDVMMVPAGLGLIIGMLSASLLMALINTVIVLISYVAGILVFILAGNLGAGQPLILDFYLEQTANIFVIATTPMYAWIPALLCGLVLRYFLLKLLVSNPTLKS
jgi:hypothetical protein